MLHVDELRERASVIRLGSLKRVFPHLRSLHSTSAFGQADVKASDSSCTLTHEQPFASMRERGAHFPVLLDVIL